MLWKREQRIHDAYPVGKQPYPIAPKCGLYRVLDTTTTSSTIDDADRYKVFSEASMSALPCSSSTVSLQASARTTVYNVAATCSLLASTRRAVLASASDDSKPRDRLALFFPISECGANVESFLVSLNNVPLFGEIVRSRRRDGRLIPSRASSKAAFLGDTSDVSDEEDEDEKEKEKEKGGDDFTPGVIHANRGGGATLKNEAKLLYYYVVDNINLSTVLSASPSSPQGEPEGADGGDYSDVLQLHISWRSRSPTSESQGGRRISSSSSSSVKGCFHVMYPLYCAPRYPDSISLRVELKPPDSIWRIKSPNARTGVLLHATINGHKASARVTTTLGNPLRDHALTGDYLFVFEVSRGEPPRAAGEEVSVWGVTAIVVVAAWFIWFILTKDLTL